MSIEVDCPSCAGSIQIEDISEVVECPLCQYHLQIDPETNQPILVSEDQAEESNQALEDSVSDATGESEADESENTTDANSNEDTDTPQSVEALIEEENTEEGAEVGETKTEEETTAPFSFLPGANQDGNSANTKRNRTDRPPTNFSFLPGGSSDSEESEEETVTTTSETEASETDTEEETPESESSKEAADTEPEEIATAGTSTTNVEAESEATVEEEAASEESTPAEDNESTEETTSEETEPVPNAASETSLEPESPVVQQDYKRQKVVPKRLFTLTLTYAIAVTIMVALLLYNKYLGDPHQLESLPDLKPPIKNDEIALQLVPENAKLPVGHVLKLGEPGRRYGNVLVTPLRVTRGPIEFEHYAGDKTRTRAPTRDVLKLYLRFENVSDDQTFEPLDQKLLLTRVSGKTPEHQFRANNFVSRMDQKRTDGERVLVYDMPPSWEWNLKGQNINQESKPQNLEPGESFETYVATTEEGIDSLQGELVWRLQLRKGYNPKSHRGVTTLIEVVFNSDQIETEAPTKNQQTNPTT